MDSSGDLNKGPALQVQNHFLQQSAAAACKQVQRNRLFSERSDYLIHSWLQNTVTKSDPGSVSAVGVEKGIQIHDGSSLKGEKKERRNYRRQPNQGHKIKRDNVAKLIFLKDPN